VFGPQIVTDGEGMDRRLGKKNYKKSANRKETGGKGRLSKARVLRKKGDPKDKKKSPAGKG